MQNEPRELRVRTMLSLQRALLGNVYPELRAICFRIEEDAIAVTYYFEKNASPEAIESMSDVEGEVIAEFDPSIDIRFDIMKVQGPIPRRSDVVWVFWRHED